MKDIKTAAKSLIRELPNKRAQDVIVSRFGLDGKKPRTLEAIGKKYGITRERVRQIEAHALSKMRTSAAAEQVAPIIAWFVDEINAHGAVVGEDYFYNNVLADDAPNNYAAFFISLGNDFKTGKENDKLHSHIIIDKKAPEKVSASLEALHKDVGDEPFGQEEVLNKFSVHVASAGLDSSPKALLGWLHLSKLFTKNAMGEWGRVSSPNISPRGVKDLAYIAMKKHGSPLHFREVATAIKDNLRKSAHAQTVHNELIKDNRFVLVGRGMYALSEWGYKKGVVRDVIRDVLAKGGRMTKEDLIRRVMQERYVKENTILINLQADSCFKKHTDGTFSLA